GLHEDAPKVAFSDLMRMRQPSASPLQGFYNMHATLASAFDITSLSSRRSEHFLPTPASTSVAASE
ncbi:unnamed protein product, partial [Amoebophrya sp. A25]